jgi:hypothetical protein
MRDGVKAVDGELLDAIVEIVTYKGGSEGKD